jgi:hypothetical protein
MFDPNTLLRYLAQFLILGKLKFAIDGLTA